MFDPASHLQGVAGGSVLFKWLVWHVKNACGAGHVPSHSPLGGQGARPGAFLFQVTGASGPLHGSSGSLGIWGLDAGAPIFHSELEPLPSAADLRAWNWKHGRKLGQAEIRHRPQRNSTFFFFFIRVFGLAQLSQLSQKFVSPPSGLVRA